MKEKVNVLSSKRIVEYLFFFLPIFCMLQEFFSVILLVLSHPAVKLLSLPQLPISVGILYSLFAASSRCSTTSPVAVFLAASMKFPVRGQVEECRCAAGTKITALVFKILYSALQELFDPSCISPALFGISLALQIKNQQNNVVHNLIQSTSTEKILSTKGIYSIWFTLWFSKPHNNQLTIGAIATFHHQTVLTCDGACWNAVIKEQLFMTGILIVRGRFANLDLHHIVCPSPDVDTMKCCLLTTLN